MAVVTASFKSLPHVVTVVPMADTVIALVIAVVWLEMSLFVAAGDSK